jgi:hypothetical protein
MGYSLKGDRNVQEIQQLLVDDQNRNLVVYHILIVELKDYYLIPNNMYL